jgi:hypothetical protein
MPCAARLLLLVLVLLIGLGACAPVLVTRTPTPAAPGTTEITLGAGYPVGLTLTPCEAQPADPGCFEGHGLGPAYWPTTLPFTLHVAQSRSENSEINFSVMAFPNPELPLVGGRLGAKDRFRQAPVALALDYGASLYLSNLGVDGGVLAAVPAYGTELYGALRGFGAYYFGWGLGGGAALTIGNSVPLGDSNVLFELSLLASLYNNLAPDSRVQPLGFALVPAIGFAF